MPDITRDKLMNLYHERNFSQREIAEKFGVSQSWISKKMSEHEVESRYKGYWTDEEIKKLKDYYPEKAEKLKSEIKRSWNAIKLKAIELGLSRDQDEYRNSEEVAERLRQLSEESRVDVDFSKKEALSYAIGVMDGDGFHDNENAIGLETKSEDFADKFAAHLGSVGLNPGRGVRRGRETVWASSKSFVEWLIDFSYSSKFEWLTGDGNLWKYLEGAYDSDGDLSNPGPRICSYDEEEKQFLKRILDHLNLESSIHSNNVYVRVSSRQKFFRNIDPVYERRSP